MLTVTLVPSSDTSESARLPEASVLSSRFAVAPDTTEPVNSRPFVTTAAMASRPNVVPIASRNSPTSTRARRRESRDTRAALMSLDLFDDLDVHGPRRRAGQPALEVAELDHAAGVKREEPVGRQR